MASSPESNLEDVIAVIRAQHNFLPTSQRKVAEFLLGHGLDVIHYTVAQIADSEDLTSFGLPLKSPSPAQNDW